MGLQDIVPSDNFYRALQNMIDKMSTNDVKRMVFGLKFELAPDVVIGIKGCAFFSPFLRFG